MIGTTFGSPPRVASTITTSAVVRRGGKLITERCVHVVVDRPGERYRRRIEGIG